MATSTARVLALLEILQAGGIRTVGDLAGRLEVDERTIRRSVKHLSDLGVPVLSIRGRYGGYRLAPGYRMPPLMLTNEEALAVLLGLAAGRRSRLFGTSAMAGESAAAKLRRVLPEAVSRRLDALLDTMAVTAPTPDSTGTSDVETELLLRLAEAAKHRHPVAIGYTDRAGRRSDRVVHPYGVVAHSGRWYVTGADTASGENRSFRLDRITAITAKTGSFEVPSGFDPVTAVIAGIAATPWKHDVSLRVRADLEHLRRYLPPSVAVATELDGGWLDIQLRAERLDWIPPVLAAMDRPFVVERPAALRDLIRALVSRLADYAS
ncbi:WYL domain-containing protein [Mycobacterium hodleri]|uniref:WYL domain-containing protein n=1 Tax=Mycolicibacterium hodleri TaxID=49897 RepID=A0A544W1U3_9MYCO|nr:WYL domain-containing protein [Mycolicibacterium hodleri]TQR86214.1 WYL domain-containing protein [Mycolicibacterium hodleri]